MQLDTPPTSTDAEIARAAGERLGQHLAEDASRVKIVVGGRHPEELALPAAALRVLVESLTEIGKGHAVRVVPQESEMTAQEAADLLNLSRPYVARLIEAGKIPSQQKGSRCVLRLDDVLTYKRASDADRRQALDNLVSEGQELGMGY